MITLRDYQTNGITQTQAHWRSGKLRVLCVAPTGSGKGTMAAHLLVEEARAGRRALCIAHRREIVSDIATRCRGSFARVGVALPGVKRDPEAPIQVASTQTLLGSAVRPYDLVVVDEAHHYAADEWREIFGRLGSARVVGLTATPQRADGKPMGDVFEELVDVVSYSRLLADGLIVGCDVLRPERPTGIDLAQDPVDAYLRYAPNTCAFIFARRVDAAVEFSQRLNANGVSAEVIHNGTGAAPRKRALEGLHDGRVTVIVNAYTMTEGVDVPRVSTVVLARNCEHESTYLQMVGRALRAHPGKARALLIDLHGVSHAHGAPTDDRAYSLRGRGIGAGEPREVPPYDERTPTVLGLDLVTAGGGNVAAPASDARKEAWDALAVEVEAGRMTVVAAVDAFSARFSERPPWVRFLSDAAKERERARLSAMHRRLGPLKYQEVFG